MNINRIQSNQNKPAFTALDINEKAIREAGTKVFNGVRQTLIPEEGRLSSKLQNLAERCDVYIGSREPQKETLHFQMKRGNDEKNIYNFKTEEYASEIELGNAIYDEIENLYNNSCKETKQEYM